MLLSSIIAMLPRSVHATEGMIGLGDAGYEGSDTHGTGVQFVYAARTAAIAKVRAPTFGYLNVKLRGSGDPYRGAVLVLRMQHKEE